MLKGVGVSPGVCIGSASVWKKASRGPKDATKGHPRDELARLASAVEESKRQLSRTIADLEPRVGTQEARIFKTHLALLSDPLLIGQIHAHIQSSELSAEAAVQRAIKALIEKFHNLKDDHLRERAADLADVGERLLDNLGRKRPGLNWTKISGRILCAQRLTPSQIAWLDPERVLGIVLEQDGQTSHTAILARAFRIPAVFGVKGVLAELREGDQLILDGSTGQVIVRPDQRTVQSYQRRMNQERAVTVKHFAAVGEAMTLDGWKIEIGANIGSLVELAGALSAGAESIGLFRTEHLFLGRKQLPDEDEQFEVYKAVLSQLATRRVIFRLLDTGGDKAVTSLKLAREENPALGLRGIRLTLQKGNLFRAQLRALLRAGAFGNSAILLPMVSELNEVLAVKEFLRRITKELTEAGETIAEDIPLGVMIETPAAALIAEDLIQEVDFLSIGTNDLIQYVLAADRANNQVAYLYQPFHPAVLRLMKHTVEAAHRAGKRVVVCGEMAADPLAVSLFVGMGVHALSLDSRSIALVKHVVRRLNRTDAASLLDRVVALRTDVEVRARLEEFLKGSSDPDVLESSQNR